MAGGAVWSPLFQDPSLPISLQTLKSKSTCHCEPGACVLRDKGGSVPPQPLIVPILGLREGCATSEKWGNGSRRGEQVQKVEERAPSGWTIQACVSTQKRCDFNVTTSLNFCANLQARERLADTWTQPQHHGFLDRVHDKEKRLCIYPGGVSSLFSFYLTEIWLGERLVDRCSCPLQQQKTPRDSRFWAYREELVAERVQLASCLSRN